MHSRFPSSASLMSTFFLPPPQLPPSLYRKPYRSPLFCTHPRPTHPQSPQPNTPNPSPLSTFPLPTPSSSPPLLRKPESVLAATAAGLFLLAATAWRSARVVIASLVARSLVLNERNQRKQLLASREKERVFLETAVESTQVTLENTNTFLKAQKKRLSLANERLTQLEVERKQLENAADTVRKRGLELTRVEAQLEREKRKGGKERDQLRVLEAQMQGVRDNLKVKEEYVRSERERLEKEEAEQKVAVDAMKTEAGRLESVLLEKEVQLRDEREERDAFHRKFGEVEKELGKRNVEFEKTLGELEERRRRIEMIQKETETVGRVVKKREAWLRQRGIENDLQTAQESSQRLQTEIQSALKSLALAGDEQAERTKERERLAGMIAERDAQLSDLRDQLRILQTSTDNGPRELAIRDANTAEGLSVASDAICFDGDSGTSLTNDQAEPDEDLVTQAGIVSDDISVALRNSEAAIASPPEDANLQGAVSHGRSQETQDTGDVVTLTSTVSSDSDLHMKRRRGRPRRSPVPDETQPKKPKRPRGRPRKKLCESESISTLHAEPRRKRGRPRKKPLIQLVPQQAE